MGVMMNKIIEQSEGLKIHGRWRLTARRADTGEIIVKEGEQIISPESLPEPWRFKAREGKMPDEIILEGENLIVTIGKNLIGWMLIDASGYDTGLTYCAIGTGTTAPAAGDTTLTTESARKAITSKTINTTTHEITLSTFFTKAESTYFIKEAGIFGHSTAGAGANTGVLASHFLVSFDNSGGLYDVTLDLIWTIA